MATTSIAATVRHKQKEKKLLPIKFTKIKNYENELPSLISKLV